MSEEQKIIEDLKKIEQDFKKNLSEILNERDQKIAEILKKENEEKRQQLSSDLSS